MLVLFLGARQCSFLFWRALGIECVDRKGFVINLTPSDSYQTHLTCCQGVGKGHGKEVRHDYYTKKGKTLKKRPPKLRGEMEKDKKKVQLKLNEIKKILVECK